MRRPLTLHRFAHGAKPSFGLALPGIACGVRGRRDRGIALLLALLVLTILVVLVGQMVISAAHNRSVAQNTSNDLMNSYGVKAGYFQARLYLQADAERGTQLDSVNEVWAQPIELALDRTRVRVAIEDAGAKINLAQLVTDKGEPNAPVVAQLERLLVSLGHPQEVAQRILDYEDADTRGDFEVRARNERMRTLDELERIDGIPREVIYGDDTRRGILPYVTLWPQTSTGGAGLINVNTAPAEVLLALDDEMSPPLAAAIVAHRSKRGSDGSFQHFKQVSDLAAVTGMTKQILDRIAPRLTVTSPAFEIRVRSATGAVEKSWLYVVTRAATPKGAITLTLVAQRRETEARSLKPPQEE